MTDAQHDLVAAVDQLRRSIDTLRDELVRKDVFQEVVRNLTDRINDVKGDVDQSRTDLKEDLDEVKVHINRVDSRFDAAERNRSKDKWLILTGLVFPALVGILLLYVATQIGGSPT